MNRGSQPPDPSGAKARVFISSEWHGRSRALPKTIYEIASREPQLDPRLPRSRTRASEPTGLALCAREFGFLGESRFDSMDDSQLRNAIALVDRGCRLP